MFGRFFFYFLFWENNPNRILFQQNKNIRIFKEWKELELIWRRKYGANVPYL